MGIDEEQRRLGGGRVRSTTPVSGFVAKIVAYAAAAVLLVLAFIFSVVLLAIVMTGGIVLLGYLWWRTRELRKRIRERPPGGRVIEGEAIHEAEEDDRTRR
jgi:hypothetical protein